MDSVNKCTVIIALVVSAAVCLVALGLNTAHGLTYVPGYRNSNAQFGSIAYSKSTGHWGYSYGYGDPTSANLGARNYCGKDDCEVMVVFWNGCGALAKGRNGGMGWGTAGSRSGAESQALQECNSIDSDCEVICWACSGR